MEKKITRRDMIKALIAGSGGIVAAGFVPEKWLKPVVKSGVLPAHAQASAPQPTQTPDYIRGGYIDGDWLLAYAYVSSQPIPEFPTENNSLSSTKVQVVSNPVVGKDVTLYIDDEIYVPTGDTETNPKKTDADGYVGWELAWDIQQITVIDPGKETSLKFVMEGGFDEVVFPGWR